MKKPDQGTANHSADVDVELVLTAELREHVETLRRIRSNRTIAELWLQSIRESEAMAERALTMSAAAQLSVSSSAILTVSADLDRGTAFAKYRGRDSSRQSVDSNVSDRTRSDPQHRTGDGQ